MAVAVRPVPRLIEGRAAISPGSSPLLAGLSIPSCLPSPQHLTEELSSIAQLCSSPAAMTELELEDADEEVVNPVELSY